MDREKAISAMADVVEYAEAALDAIGWTEPESHVARFRLNVDVELRQLQGDQPVVEETLLRRIIEWLETDDACPVSISDVTGWEYEVLEWVVVPAEEK